MADKYLELIDGVITEREVITKSLGYGDAGKIPGLGDDGRLDIFMMSKDVFTTLNPPPGASTFIDLIDTPTTYAGQAGLFPKVSAGETGLEFASGAGGDSLPVIDATSMAKGSADATKQVRFEVDGLTTATTRVLTVPDKDIIIAGTVDISDHAALTETHEVTGAVVGTTNTQTLTNKRTTPRITTIVSHATPTINTDNCDTVTITAQAEAITSMTTNLSGAPTNFQKLIVRIKDDGTLQAINWGASFVAKGVALPTTTVATKLLTVGFFYDTVAETWGCVASAQEA